ncbi:MAG: MBL fold metallo-hydrolase [Myxococcota bacterium]
MHSGVVTTPFRTPTLPPATHTNTWLVGEGRFSVVDPASPYDDEHEQLVALIQARLSRGEHVERLVLTHHHHDHVSGAVRLQQALQAIGHTVPIAAHRLTAELLQREMTVDVLIEDGELLQCGDTHIRALHTPGHAPGHLVFHNEQHGWMIAGDMVAGIGTILLHPSEGDLGQYIDSLHRMSERSPTVLLPSHGPDLTEPKALLGMYVAHRHMRTQQVRESLEQHGTQTAAEIAARVYAELDPRFLPIAALQLTTHLMWMHEHGLAAPDKEQMWRRA